MADILPTNTPAAADKDNRDDLFDKNNANAVNESVVGVVGTSTVVPNEGGVAAAGVDAVSANLSSQGGMEIDNSLFGDINDANENEYDESTNNIGNSGMGLGDNDYSDQEHWSINQKLESNPPPAPLPTGWFLKKSHSYPGKFYYFNQDTGICSWDAYVVDQGVAQESPEMSIEGLNATAAAAAAAVKSILKRSSVAPTVATTADTTDEINIGGLGDDADQRNHHHKNSSSNSHSSVTSPPSRKKIKMAMDDTNERSERGERSDRSDRNSREKERSRDRDRSSGGSDPKEVRVLHILKKHRDSRRPASWRNPKITDSKQKVGIAPIILSSGISLLREYTEFVVYYENFMKLENGMNCSRIAYAENSMLNSVMLSIE